MKTKLAVVIGLVALAVLCPAPIKQAPPEGVAQPPMSMSQDQLERQQAEQQRMSEVGKVPERTEAKAAIDSQSSADAVDTLRNASVDPARDVIQKASKDLEAQKSSRSPVWIFLGVMVVLGLGVAFAFRQWAEKNVPEAPNSHNKQAW